LELAEAPDFSEADRVNCGPAAPLWLLPDPFVVAIPPQRLHVAEFPLLGNEFAAAFVVAERSDFPMDGDDSPGTSYGLPDQLFGVTTWRIRSFNEGVCGQGEPN
jgi:hypothetical protein